MLGKTVTQKMGKIHNDDNHHKLLTLLLYMNPNWTSTEGNLRLLKNPQNINDFVAEVLPKAGTLIVFKLTKNSWNGHTSFKGKRQGIQMNYLDSKIKALLELWRHNITSKIKLLSYTYLNK